MNEKPLKKKPSKKGLSTYIVAGFALAYIIAIILVGVFASRASKGQTNLDDSFLLYETFFNNYYLRSQNISEDEKKNITRFYDVFFQEKILNQTFRAYQEFNKTDFKEEDLTAFLTEPLLSGFIVFTEYYRLPVVKKDAVTEYNIGDNKYFGMAMWHSLQMFLSGMDDFSEKKIKEEDKKKNLPSDYTWEELTMAEGEKYGRIASFSKLKSFIKSLARESKSLFDEVKK